MENWRPNSNVAGPYGRQADGSEEVLPRSKSAAINPRAIWGAAGSQRKQGMAIRWPSVAFFFASVYTCLHINFNETTFFTTWNNYNCNYCILLLKDPQRSTGWIFGNMTEINKSAVSPGGGWLWAGASSASDCGLLRCETNLEISRNVEDFKYYVWLKYFPKWWFLTNYLQYYNILFQSISYCF